MISNGSEKDFGISQNSSGSLGLDPNLKLSLGEVCFSIKRNY